MTRLFSRFSVRTKLFISSLIITLVSMLVVGVYLFERRQQAADFLIEQMLNTAHNNAENQLAAQTAREASQIGLALEGVKTDVSQSAAYATQLLDRVDLLGTGSYWNAPAKLKRLDQEQWDNDNSELGAIYLPAGNSLTAERVKELNTLKYLDFFLPNVLAADPEIVAVYFIDPAGGSFYYPNNDLAAVVGDFDPTQELFYALATPENNPEKGPVWTQPYQDPAGEGLIVTVSAPVYDSEGNFRGVLGADVQLSKISQTIAGIRAGDTGYAFLIDQGGHVVGMPERAYDDFGLTPETVLPGETPKQTVLFKGSSSLQDATDKMRRGGSGVAQFAPGDGVEHYIAYSKVSGPNYSLGLVVPVNETIGQALEAVQTVANQTRQATLTVLTLFVIIAGIAAVVVYFAARTLTRPLQQLTGTAREISSGNLEAVAPIVTRDEIGALAITFNAMTTRLRDMINSLETQVELRTAQIRASADVGQAAASSLDPDELLSRVVHLITDRFGFYYAGVFLTDPGGRWAVLREASGPGDAGRLLRQAGHRLELDSESMVAAAIRRRRPRIAQAVEEETVRFVNPLLPDTRSEVALPLIASGEVLGALDVQSVQAGAFDEASTIALQSMVDQIAVALNNARQYRREQERAQQMTGLVEATIELASLGEEADIYAQVVDLSTTLLHASDAVLCVPLPRSEQLEITRVTGHAVQDLLHQHLHQKEGVVGAAYRNGYAMRLSREQSHLETWLAPVGPAVHDGLALPLTWHGQVVGVLVVLQTVAGGAFKEEAVTIAQLFASQAAAVIENARLLDQVQTTLEELSAANRRITGEAWQTRVRAAQVAATYQADEAPANFPVTATLQVPIELRGQPIGVVTLADERLRQELSADEQIVLENVVQQMVLALESARLFEQTQTALSEARRLARREQLINRLVGQLRSATSVEEVLHVAATEMRHAVQATYAVAQLTPPDKDGQE
jgi:GAF domain-containing protein/HAMP domain-containing protein